MKTKLTLIFLLTAFLLFACSPDSATENANAEVELPQVEEVAETAAEEVAEESKEIKLTDGLDREITLDGPAIAIVALGPSALEGLFAIGAGDQIVGREEYSTFPEAALEIPSVGNVYSGLPTEAILALEPDLVIAPQIVSQENVQTLEDLGLTVYWQANPSDFQGLYENLRALAQLTGHDAEATDLIASLTARVNAVEEITAYIEDLPTVFYELDATDPESPYTVGSGVFIDNIIALAGGINIGAVLSGEYAQMSSEEVILQNPEIILLADALYGVSPEIVAARAGWESISAVINGQVLPFDPFLVSVPGPRMVDGLETMASILHPDLFK